MSFIKVHLDNYNKCCYPGQTLSGKVECYFNKEKKLRAVTIKFKGRAQTEWTKTESQYDYNTKKQESKNVKYHAEEEYFSAERNLVQGGDELLLPAGKHFYPFTYVLPANLPSSFEGSYGNVRYYIKAVVERPWTSDYEHTFSLNVVSPVDLNSISGVRDPVDTSVDKTMCSCWCKDAGVLSFEMSLPATGFVPGQEVHIGSHVENMTNVNVNCVKFEIISKLQFITHYPSTDCRDDEKLITECKETGIGAHCDKSWTSTLEIPTDHSYPNFAPCSIININYRLKAKVIVSFPHDDFENEVPIVIGSVPLTGVTTTFSVSPPVEEILSPTIDARVSKEAKRYSVAVPYLTSTPPYPPESPTTPPPCSPGTPPYPTGELSYPAGPSLILNGFDDKISLPASPGSPPYPSGEPLHPPIATLFPPSALNEFGGRRHSAPSPAFGTRFPSGFAPRSYEDAKDQKKKNEKSG